MLRKHNAAFQIKVTRARIRCLPSIACNRCLPCSEKFSLLCVHRHSFESLQHVSRVIGDWISFYNHQRPH